MSDAPNRIRELRMAAGLSQQKLGDRIGVSKMTISDLERGNMSLDVDYMTRLAKALSVDPTDLLPSAANPWALSEDEKLLVAKFRLATDDQKEQVQRLADVIIPFRPKDAQDAA